MLRLLRLGVSLTEQGYPDLPAVLGDWLIELDDAEIAEAKARAEAAKAAQR